MTAEEYYRKGNEHRQRGEWGKAMSCYLEAIDLDPESPAVHAKEMLDNIMNYYCKDMYNPYLYWLRFISQIRLTHKEQDYGKIYWCHCGRH